MPQRSYFYPGRREIDNNIDQIGTIGSFQGYPAIQGAYMAPGYYQQYTAANYNPQAAAAGKYSYPPSCKHCGIPLPHLSIQLHLIKRSFAWMFVKFGDYVCAIIAHTYVSVVIHILRSILNITRYSKVKSAL